MNRTAYNNTTQTLNIPYTLIQPVIPGKQITIETTEEWAVQRYENLILSIMKAIDLQYVTHCTNNEYQLITIHRADDTLIHIKLSKTLMKQLLKQKDKPKSIKTGVNQIHQSSLLLNRIIHHMTSNLIKEWQRQQSLKMDIKEDNKEDNKVQKKIINWQIKKIIKRTPEYWYKRNNDKRHAKRPDQFPEEDIVDRITICR